jgi:hypothetical protein
VQDLGDEDIPRIQLEVGKNPVHAYSGQNNEMRLNSKSKTNAKMIFKIRTNSKLQTK